MRGPSSGNKRVYVVEPERWGYFIRAQCIGEQEFHFDIKAISAERAQELLEQDPNYLPNEPEVTSKKRKLQTCVEIIVNAKYGYQVTDPSRARQIVTQE